MDTLKSVEIEGKLLKNYLRTCFPSKEQLLIFTFDYRFHWGHIWSCPPSEGDDYIFHCHPPEQKIPKQKRLVEWYKKMLDKAQTDGVIVEYKVRLVIISRLRTILIGKVSQNVYII